MFGTIDIAPSDALDIIRVLILTVTALVLIIMLILAYMLGTQERSRAEDQVADIRRIADRSRSRIRDQVQDAWEAMAEHAERRR